MIKMGNSFTPTVVSHVELPKYMGTWYEIARKPAFFEDSSAKNVRATYQLMPDGRVSVLNEEEIDGQMKAIRGVAKVTNPTTNSQLEVKFNGVPFAGEYWIVMLGKDVNGIYPFAVVSDSSGKYLWILSRTKQFEYLGFVIDYLRNQGFPGLEKLIYTTQS